MASLLVDLGAEVDRVVTFGVPRLATPRFQKFYKSQSLWTRTTNYRTPRDVVTRLPVFYRGVGRYRDLVSDADGPWEQHDMAAYIAALDD